MRCSILNRQQLALQLAPLPVGLRTAALLLGLLSACTLHGNNGQLRPGRPFPNTSIIGQDQLGRHRELPSAYTVVEALHANWLLERSAESSGGAARRRALPSGWRAPAGENAGVQVYLDGHRLGGVELLRNIPTVSVLSIRHLSANEAQSRYGAGHSQGAILVQTLSQRR